MTLLAVPIFVHDIAWAGELARRARAQGADIVEYRIDPFVDGAKGDLKEKLDALAALVKRSPLPCVVTCRSAGEGGYFDGDDQSRIAILEHLGLAGPACLDVEYASYRRSANLRQKVHLVIEHPDRPRASPTKLILSAHDFAGPPRDVAGDFQAMRFACAQAIIKTVWKSTDIAQCVDALKLLGDCADSSITLCMGDTGLPTRVLAKKFGAFLTFAALQSSEATAPGQPTISDLKKLYRWNQLGPATQVFGVIGHPVGHSMSPPIHNAGFDATGFDGVYLPLPIAPTYEDFHRDVTAWLGYKPLDFRGASVTLPHKENLLRFVKERGNRRDEVEQLAQVIGAANTLTVRDDGSLYVSNTDYAAALDSVCDAMGVKRAALRGKRVAVIGAGGAARAIVAGFAHHGATVVIYNRTRQRAEVLAEEFNGCSPGAKVVAVDAAKLCDSCCEVYINCTPLGMHPKIDATPVDSQKTRSWGQGVVVFDTIYNPIQTRLLREAKADGCTTVSGVEMFVRQALGQFKQWTGIAAPAEIFRGVVVERLSSH